MTQPNKGFMQELIHCCDTYGIKTITFIDRLHLHYDGRSTSITLSPKQVKTNIERELSDAHHMDRKLELLQLRKKHLEQLKDDLKGDYKINRIEFTIYFVTNNKKSFKVLQTFFFQHLVKTRSKGFYFCKKKKTVYYNPAGDDDVTLFYYDRQSKLSDHKYCFHLEIRVKRAKEIAAYADVITLSDVINFDYLNFFNKKLDFRSVTLKQLGIHAYPSKKVTRPVHSADGKKKLKEIPNLQEFLSHNSSYQSVFTKMTTPSIKKKLGKYSKAH